MLTSDFWDSWKKREKKGEMSPWCCCLYGTAKMSILKRDERPKKGVTLNKIVTALDASPSHNDAGRLKWSVKQSNQITVLAHLHVRKEERKTIIRRRPIAVENLSLFYLQAKSVISVRA